MKKFFILAFLLLLPAFVYASGISGGAVTAVPEQAQKNAIINGKFDIWQRGTSFSGLASQDYTADRFIYSKVGTMVHSAIQSADVPTQAQASVFLNFSYFLDVTTAQGVLGAGDVTLISQRIEGFNFAPFQGRTATLSFWVKAVKTGIYCAAFTNFGADRSYVVEYTINSSNTWERKTITLDFSDATGTWNYQNSRGITVSWTLASGATFQTTPNAWQTGNFVATSNQVNGVDNVANDFRLAAIQFELGNNATVFEYRTIQEELEMCQRYFQKSYNLDVAPGTVTDIGQLAARKANVDTVWLAQIPRFLVQMRDTPTVTLYSPATADASGTVRDLTAVTDRAASAIHMGSTGFSTQLSVSVATPNVIALHYTAESEL